MLENAVIFITPDGDVGIWHEGKCIETFSQNYVVEKISIIMEKKRIDEAETS